MYFVWLRYCKFRCTKLGALSVKIKFQQHGLNIKSIQNRLQQALLTFRSYPFLRACVGGALSYIPLRLFVCCHRRFEPASSVTESTVDCSIACVCSLCSDFCFRLFCWCVSVRLSWPSPIDRRSDVPAREVGLSRRVRPFRRGEGSHLQCSPPQRSAQERGGGAEGHGACAAQPVSQSTLFLFLGGGALIVFR